MRYIVDRFSRDVHQSRPGSPFASGDPRVWDWIVFACLKRLDGNTREIADWRIANNRFWVLARSGVPLRYRLRARPDELVGNKVLMRFRMGVLTRFGVLVRSGVPTRPRVLVRSGVRARFGVLVRTGVLGPFRVPARCRLLAGFGVPTRFWLLDHFGEIARFGVPTRSRVPSRSWVSAYLWVLARFRGLAGFGRSDCSVRHEQRW